MERIPVAGPWITQKEIDYVTDAVTNAWYGNHNMYHDRFEAAFASYLDVQYAILLPSCTSAIHLSLLAYGIGPGDEVIVPEATWIATAAPIAYVGAEPVFADIEPDTWCLSVESFEKCITPATKAVIPVDLYGNMPDFDAIRAVADANGIAVIEDAAQAIGSEYTGKKAGSLGNIGVFSFHGSKTLTTGEGGMLVTNDSQVRDRIEFLRDHGRSQEGRRFWNTEIAYKYKMSSMQAALGLAQLERIGELVERKRTIFAWYQERLNGLSWITLNQDRPETFNTYWMVTAMFDRTLGLDKAEIIASMGDKRIDCRPFFYPLSSLPAFRDRDQSTGAERRNPTSYQISRTGVNLPSGMNMTKDNVSFVCDALEALIESH